jgi:hypothetical protein
VRRIPALLIECNEPFAPKLQPLTTPNSQSAGIRRTPNASRYTPFQKVLFASISLLGLLVFLSDATAADSSVLQAGVARVDITPPMQMKAALGGYGARESKPAIGIHDSVWAKALLLTQGDKKFVLVTADVLAFPHQFKAAVVERLAP